MQKFIRISAIAAVILKAVALTLILTGFILQPVIANIFYDYSITEWQYTFPTTAFVSVLFSLGATIPLMFCCGKNKGGIVLELIVFGLLLLVIPFINDVGAWLCNMLMARMYGVYQMGMTSIANSIANFCAIPGGWGSAVAYAACGMSVVFKRMNKQQGSVLTEN